MRAKMCWFKFLPALWIRRAVCDCGVLPVRQPAEVHTRQQTSFHQPNQPRYRSHSCATGTLFVGEAHQPVYSGHDQNSPFFSSILFFATQPFFLFFVNRPHFINQINPKTGHILCNRHFIWFWCTLTRWCIGHIPNSSSRFFRKFSHILIQDTLTFSSSTLFSL